MLIILYLLSLKKIFFILFWKIFPYQVTSGKNEVVMEFHLNDDSPLSLVEMRFHVPQSNAAQLPEDVDSADAVAAGVDNVKELHDRILAKADVIQATGDAIVTFSETHCLTPRCVPLPTSLANIVLHQDMSLYLLV